MCPATFWPAGGRHRRDHLRPDTAVAAWALFASRISELVRLLRLGRPENRFDHLGDRIKYFTLMVLGQRGVLRDPLPGIAHFFTFWGFIIIQLDALNLWAMGFNFELPIITSRAFAVTAGFLHRRRVPRLLIFAYRRAGAAPKQLQSQTHGMADAYIILGLIALVLRLALLLRGLRLRRHQRRGLDPLRRARRRRRGAASPRAPPSRSLSVSWWANVLVVLGFLIYLPHSKHLHLLATPFNVFFRNYRPIGALQTHPQHRGARGLRRLTRSTSSPGSNCSTATPAPSAGAATASVRRWPPISRSGRRRSSSASRRSSSPPAAC